MTQQMRPLLKLPSLLLACLLFFPLLSQAQTAEQYEAGKNYLVLDTPVRTRDSSKVEVVEVFWYGCSHCYSFEPLIKQWSKGQPEDVDFWQSPAIWNGAMKLHAQAYFTAKALSVLDKLHEPIFTALLVERQPLGNAKQIENLFANYGVDRKEFQKTFDSFSINSQVKQADARARSYKVSGTPEVIVNGKYRVTARLAGGQPEMLSVINFLVDKERQQLASQ